MNEKDLMKAIGEVDGDLVDGARRGKRPHSKAVKKLLAAAACLAVICAGGYYALSDLGADAPKLTRSSGVSVRKSVVALQPESSSADLIYLTEDELINGWNEDIKTDIFYATVTDIEHITVNFNGRSNNWSLVTLEVGKVLHGDCKQGDSVVVQLHFSLSGDVLVEDTGVASQLAIGSTGIFMPMKYTDDSTYSTNGATLYLAELSPYGLADGERFMFLQGDGGVAYASFAYPSLGDDASLEQIEAFITETMK